MKKTRRINTIKSYKYPEFFNALVFTTNGKMSNSKIAPTNARSLMHLSQIT